MILIPAYDEADMTAMQALQRGDASPEQQRRALTWILEGAANLYDLSYKSEQPLDTAFAEGRRFVGLQIIKLIKLNLQAFKKEPKQ